MMTTIKSLFGVGPEVGIATNDAICEFVPARDDAYRFRADLVRRLLVWHSGIAGKNFFVQGPTGSGKSSLVEQFCSRMGIALYRVPCHGRSEFSDFTGQLTVKENGSTEFVYGALPRAMRNGSVILFDEFNFIPPSVSGALNTVLDGGPLLLPETGEIIVPAPGFRIAATGNAVSQGDDAASYRGIQRMNLALLQRFLHAKVEYLDVLDEAAVLNRNAPNLPPKVIEKLVAIADDVRKAFLNGSIETPLATRVLIKMAKIMEARLPLVIADPMAEAKFALQFTLTDGAKVEDATVIEATLQRYGMPKLDPLSMGTPAPAATTSAKQSVLSSKKPVPVNLYLNLDRQGTGKAAHWGFIDEGSAASMFNGSIEPTLATRFSASKSLGEAKVEAGKKCMERGYSHVGTFTTVAGKPHTEQLERLLETVAELVRAKRNVQTCVIDRSEIGPDNAFKLASFAFQIGVQATIV